MKKTVIMIAIAVLLLLILFVPIPRGTYRDGGTKDYRALTYRIVVWNRLTDGLSGDENGVYHKTSVFWFPHNFKSIDELWEKESGGETKTILRLQKTRRRRQRACLPSTAFCACSSPCRASSVRCSDAPQREPRQTA